MDYDKGIIIQTKSKVVLDEKYCSCISIYELTTRFVYKVTFFYIKGGDVIASYNYKHIFTNLIVIFNIYICIFIIYVLTVFE